MRATRYLDQPYLLAGRRIDPITGTLSFRDFRKHLRRKELEVLALLAEAGGEQVSRRTFIEQLWQTNPIGGEQGLTDAISALRRALDDSDRENPLILTIPRQGYQLRANARLVSRDGGVAFVSGSPVEGRPEWRLMELLERTEASEIWLAADGRSRRIFRFCRNEQQLRTLQREVTVMRYLRESLAGRSDIVTILDWQLQEPPYFLEYEPYEHGDLLAWSQAQGGLAQVPVETRLRLFEQIVTAMTAVHSTAIVHRNLGASTIGIEQRAGQWQARVGGFGFGLLAEPERLRHWQLSSAGFSSDAKGAPPTIYRPPGIANHEALTAADDIYALGVLGVQLVTGAWSLPMLSEALASMREARLRDLLQRCLNPEPASRPDAATLLQDLRTVHSPIVKDSVTPMMQPVEAESVAALAAGVEPSDVTPVPGALTVPCENNSPQPHSDEPGRQPPLAQVGPFRILDELGHGGMGTVYLAEQDAPVRRKVALKLIRAGVDSDQVLARFESERMALALMSHPNIAAILESGSTPAGLPYFAMEYVPGVDIREYCDRHKLDVRRRIELFMQVCDGVLHAHQKGIVHRDLKPGNILVRQQSEQAALVKVIDFGVAKSLQGHLVGSGSHTRFGHFVGTPAYCSPEQVASPGHQLDTRADIYSLGVVLYELLIGVTPRDESDLSQCTPQELAKLLRDSPTPTLISRFSKLSNEERQAIAIHHAMTPEAMRSLLASDLDWVVSKCIAADPDDRYATVQDFKRDLWRWLQHRPVEARPATSLYRLRKLIRRNRFGAAVISLTCLLLISTTVAAVMGYLRARSAELEARQAAAFQVDQMKAMSPESMGQSFRGNLVKSIEARLRKNDPEGAAAKLTVLAELMDGVDFTGLTTGELDQHLFAPGLRVIEEKYAAHPQLQAILRQSSADTLVALGLYERALMPQDQVIAWNKTKFGQNDPQTLNAQAKKAFILADLDRITEATELLDTTIEAMRASGHLNTTEAVQALTQRAHLYNMKGVYPGTRAYLTEALEIATRSFGPDDPRTLRAVYDREISFMGKSSLDEIEALVQKFKSAVGSDHPDTLASMELLSARQSEEGLHAEALETSQSLLASTVRVLGDNHRDVARAQANLAQSLAAVDRIPEAIDVMRTSVANTERILGRSSSSAIFSNGNLGTLLLLDGQIEEAKAKIQDTVDMAKSRYGEGTPPHLIYSDYLAQAEFLEGAFESAIERSNFVAEVIAKIHGRPDMLAESYERVARIMMAEKQYPKAHETLAKALAAFKDDDPRDAVVKIRITALMQFCEHHLGKQVLNPLRETLFKQKSDKGIGWMDTAMTVGYLAALYNDQGDSARALELTTETLAKIEAIFPDGHYAMLPLLVQETRALQSLNDKDKAQATYQAGLRIIASTSGLDVRWKQELKSALETSD